MHNSRMSIMYVHIMLAQSEYIAVMDADDAAKPYRLEKQFYKYLMIQYLQDKYFNHKYSDQSYGKLRKRRYTKKIAEKYAKASVYFEKALACMWRTKILKDVLVDSKGYG